jgi:hypothetical protein
MCARALGHLAQSYMAPGGGQGGDQLPAIREQAIFTASVGL